MKNEQQTSLIRGSFKLIVGLVMFGGVLLAGAQSHSPAPVKPVPMQKPAAAAAHTRYQASQFPKRAVMYYQDVWGIDSLKVKSAESGELVRFNYRVLDAAKAAQLNDKKAEPTLIAPRAGVRLVIPSLEKVGQLRQSNTPEAGKVYWMAFSNPRRSVKAGDRVNVVIGHFHADGLVVE